MIDLEKLRNSLPKGWKSTLSKTTEFSEVYVWQVLNGERNNSIIIDAAIDLAQQWKKSEELRKTSITNL